MIPQHPPYKRDLRPPPAAPPRQDELRAFSTVDRTRSVSFVAEGAVGGSTRNVYFSTDGRKAVSFYRGPADRGRRRRVEEISGSWRREVMNGQGSEYYREIFCWPEMSVELGGQEGFVTPVYDGRFRFGEGAQSLEGVLKEGYWFASARNMRNVPDNEAGNLLGCLNVCILLCRAMGRLHEAGLLHPGMSSLSCLASPSSGRFCLTGLDGLWKEGFEFPELIPAPDYLPPELPALTPSEAGTVRFRPSLPFDLHALAVLIYRFIFRRSPVAQLPGAAGPPPHGCPEGSGGAVFAEAPEFLADRSRSPQEADDGLGPWTDPARLPNTVLGQYLSSAFWNAFAHGLQAPSKRPSAREWESALVRTVDSLLPCRAPGCPSGWFPFNPRKPPECPFCGAKYELQSVPVLQLLREDGQGGPGGKGSGGFELTVFHDMYLYQWHSHNGVFTGPSLRPEQKKPVGFFSYHNDRWLLVNQNLRDLRDLAADKSYPPGSAVPLAAGQKLRLTRESGGRVANVRIYTRRPAGSPSPPLP
jgi:hypothetical protein